MRGGIAAAIAALALLSAAAALEAHKTEDAASWATSWSHFLGGSFYHATLLPLLALTVALAWCARPSIEEEMPGDFIAFQFTYLSVWGFCVAADWLQGPYVYALYAAYGFSSHEIAQLFVAGFASSMIFGCVVGTFADRFGRKKCCMAYCVLYILSCLTKHFQSYWVLMMGRITGGIATSMLFSCFECWMVCEHTQTHRFSRGLLSYMFGMKFTLMYAIAIATGLVAQGVADTFPFEPISQGSIIHMGGYCGPFDAAIVCLIVGFSLVGIFWKENYGSRTEDSGLIQNLQTAGTTLMSDSRMILLGIIVSSFEGAMFAFVFNWTPALESKETPPPHGLIFSLFMMACMCGSSASTVLGSRLMPTIRLMAIFAMGIFAFAIAAGNGMSGHSSLLGVTFGAFLTFEFCVGAYFPTVGILKSDLVPERVRGTIYNIYRVPLNAVVVGLLLTNISMVSCFNICAMLLTLALLAIVPIHTAGSICGASLCPSKIDEADPKHV
mmetsp:Transcript_130550/g.279062  ORF Transcript_130550/g.279062 Transcript_130550/m.279062 type:complete len:497 (-) Transcript_130550:94-1584(-)